MPDSILDRLSSCSRFAMELTPEDMDDFNFQTMTLMPEGETIEGLYTKKQYNYMQKKFFRATGCHLDLYNKLRPMILESFLVSLLVQNDYGSSPDEYLYRKALEAGLSVLSLEDAAGSEYLFEEYPSELTYKFLRKLRKNMKGFYYLMDVYNQANIELLYSMGDKKESLGDEYEDKLIRKRNIIMADRMDFLMKEGTLFTAVGAGHLGSPEGILNLLYSRGFRITPVLEECKPVPTPARKTTPFEFGFGNKKIMVYFSGQYSEDIKLTETLFGPAAERAAVYRPKDPEDPNTFYQCRIREYSPAQIPLTNTAVLFEYTDEIIQQTETFFKGEFSGQKEIKSENPFCLKLDFLYKKRKELLTSRIFFIKDYIVLMEISSPLKSTGNQFQTDFFNSLELTPDQKTEDP